MLDLLPTLTSWQAAVSGVSAAALLAVVHWLTRNRFQEQAWPAMELLRRAFERRRKQIIRRDRLLLLLRLLSLVVLGLVFARPYWASPQPPENLIMLLDNSLSMAHTASTGTRLKQAFARAETIIGECPPDAKVRIVPLCGPHRNSVPVGLASDAKRQLETIRIVDDSADVKRLQTRLEQLSPHERQSARIVLFSDLQESTWQELGPWLRSSRDNLEVVHIDDDDTANSWISALRLQDRLVADGGTTNVLVDLMHRGEPRSSTLEVHANGERIGQKPVRLVEGSSPTTVAVPWTPAATTDSLPFAFLRAEIQADQLPNDNYRTTVVPVVNDLPILLVDQIGASQGATRKGEATSIRRLLNSIGEERSAFDITSVSAAQVTRDQLAQTRLVLLAGIAPAIPAAMLLEYVAQGGQLLISAGPGFDAVEWQASVSLGSPRILPVELTGQLLTEPTQMESGDSDTARYQVATDRIARHPLVVMPGLTRSELREVLAEPVYFQAVGCRPAELSGGAILVPTPWLRWRSAARRTDQEFSQTLLEFSGATPQPLLVERRIGRGRVVFYASSLSLKWNTLANTNAVLLWDNLIRQMVQDTLPQRDFLPQKTLRIPLEDEPGKLYLIRPESPESSELLTTVHVENDPEVHLQDLTSRGIYQVVADSQKGSAAKILFSVNGVPRESDLRPLPAEAINQLHTTSTSASRTRPGFAWRFLLLGLLLLLSLENVILIVTSSAAGRRR